MSAQGTYRFYSVWRQTILLINGEALGRERVNNAKSYLPINPLTAKWVLKALKDFTLSNARRFYSSMGKPLDGKGLKPPKEGGVRKVRKPQNRTKNNKNRNTALKFTETAGCRRQDLQSFYPLKIRPAVYADINSNVKLLNY